MVFTFITKVNKAKLLTGHINELKVGHSCYKWCSRDNSLVFDNFTDLEMKIYTLHDLKFVRTVCEDSQYGGGGGGVYLYSINVFFVPILE